ncbi:KpsF/GutQ family sugar-phosphate isomerase [Candidatus Spyradosoma sp. SGI.093]|uniref:KpsF/GutQ family sugar-phosphate isomerase n=1 Tax=Candidatus Spyradosoma sp. SGI.093 TaxID=3420583 RepID=UPI003CFC1674
MENPEIVEAGKHVLKAEADALRVMEAGLDENFAKAVEILYASDRKVVISGVGKSGLIGQKIVATLCSTGTPAIFLHSADAVHGDLGICLPGDPVVLISKSGTTAETVRLLPILQRMGAKIIAIVANRNSPLAEQADVVLDIGVKSEADPLGIVPTTSTTLTLAMGDALAAALMLKRRFGEKDFAKFHPAGQLGRNLLLTVRDVMRPQGKIAVVSAETTIRDTVIAMTEFPNGAACVTDGAGELVGIITDGDLRRALHKYENLGGITAGEIMVKNPICAFAGMSLGDAARVMEDRPSQISVLPVLDAPGGKLVGVLRIHDVYQANLV